MKFLPIVWRNLLRRKFRTIFTIGAIFFAFVLFGVLMAIRSAFSMGVDMAGQERLMVIDKVSIINPLPASYEDQIKQVPGVTDITHANWFGGYYQDVRNQFPTFATDPESWLRVYSKEFELPEDQKKAFIADRTGAIVGVDTAKKYGFKVGQQIPINGTIYRRPDGGPWEFTIDGIYDSKHQGRRQDQPALQLPVPARDDSRAQRLPRSLQLVRVHHRRSRTRRRRSPRRSTRMFANSPSETKTDTEKAFVSDWAKQVGDIGKIMMWIVGDGDVHDPAGRRQHHGAGDPRADRRAGGPEDARLRQRPILRMVLLESVLIAVGRRRRSAWRCPTSFITLAATRRTGCCRRSTSRRPRWSPASSWCVALGLASGFLPAWQASRLRIVDALRRN